PHELSDIPLTVAHGYQSVRVEARDRKIPVEISAATAVRSHTHQKVTVKAAPGSLVTLAAVDNGVLQVTDFETPEPYARQTDQDPLLLERHRPGQWQRRSTIRIRYPAILGSGPANGGSL